MSKVMILANHSGGLYDFRNELLQELLKEAEVVVSVPDTTKTDLLAAEGCRIIETKMNRRGVNPAQDLELESTYHRILAKEKPDVVLTYTIKPNVYGGYVCGKLGIPYISTVTGLGSAFERSGLVQEAVRTLYRRGLKKASCVFFQNRENQEMFHEMGLISGRDRIVMGSGVNLEKWQPMEYPTEGPVQLMFVGRIMKEKGVDEFLEAAETLHTDHVMFTVAGFAEEDYKEKLDDAEKKGIIVQLGFHPDMHDLYKACSAVVLPTYHEGMSNVLMEASACARPVIASNISGCREIFEEGVTGFGFAPKSGEALTDAVRKFLALPQGQRAAMGMSGRDKMVREFDRRKVMEAYLEEIRKFL